MLLVRDPIAANACNLSLSLPSCLSRETKCGIVDVTRTLSPAEVDRFGAYCAEGGYDVIVAVGGGATMDAAKLIALRASNSKPVEQLLRDGFSPNRIPIVAAPTTAGSGSEATHFAVLFVEQEKFSLAHPSLCPSWAIVDPRLTHSSPRRVAAAAGLDVLCQSIESLWSVQADSKSTEFAKESLQLVLPSLHPAVVDRDPKAQAHLALASHLAGQAINRSFTTVCHALSYALTAHYNVPHGFAAAATLPAALLFNSGQPMSDVLAVRGNRAVSWPLEDLLEVFKASDIEEAISHVVQLIRSVGGAASVVELRLPHNYHPLSHVESVDPHRLKNNPRTVSVEDSLSLLRTRIDAEGRVIR